MRPTVSFGSSLIWLATILTGCVQFSPSPSTWNPGSFIENSLLFHPVMAKKTWINPPSSVNVEDVWLHTRDGLRIHAWWLACPASQGAILFCHGNAGNLSFWGPVTASLSKILSQPVLIFDYPGYGRSEGQPSEVGCYAAADAAYDWLVHNQRIQPDRLTLFGESLGGGVATDLASRRPHRALVLAKTFTSIPDMARSSMFTSASASLVRNSFDNLAKIEHCTGPILIAHGDRDRLIPLLQGQQLYEKARQPKQFLLLKGCDHNDPYPPDFFATLAQFLK